MSTLCSSRKLPALFLAFHLFLCIKKLIFSVTLCFRIFSYLSQPLLFSVFNHIKSSSGIELVLLSLSTFFIRIIPNRSGDWLSTFIYVSDVSSSIFPAVQRNSTHLPLINATEQSNSVTDHTRADSLVSHVLTHTPTSSTRNKRLHSLPHLQPLSSTPDTLNFIRHDRLTHNQSPKTCISFLETPSFCSTTESSFGVRRREHAVLINCNSDGCLKRYGYF